MGRSQLLMLAAVCAFVTLGCQPAPRSPQAKVATGSAPSAPKLLVTDTAGEVWDNDRLKGKTVLIEFWASWCEPCHELAPELSAFRNRNRVRMELLSISLDQSADAFSAYVKREPFSHPVAHGGQSMTKDWAVTQMPELVMVRDGHILTRWRGLIQVREGLASLDQELGTTENTGEAPNK